MNCIIDVNVLAAANLRATHLSPLDALKCIDFLESVKKEEGCVSMDEGGLIFQEYANYASHKGQPGVGDVFFKWLFDNQGYDAVCEKVAIVEHPDRGFEEYPDAHSVSNFDWNDRKYVAVAVASEKAPAIYNATDSDWWDFQEAFFELGIIVEQLCSPPAT